MPTYTGILKWSKMTPIAKKAYSTWCGQRARIGNSYPAREYIGWYIQEYEKKEWVNPHISRKDHDKPYSFDNIEMQEAAENVRERLARCGQPHRTARKVCMKYNYGGVVEYKNARTAATALGVHLTVIHRNCRNLFGKRHGLPTIAKFSWA